MIIAIAGLLVLGFLFYASYSIRSNVYIKTLSSKKTQQKIVALTFDDGPNAEQTPKILSVLHRHRAKACFFLIGNNIGGNEELVRQMDTQNHLIGNHSMCHRMTFPVQPAEKIQQEIERCNAEIRRVTGKTTIVFRPPFGVTNPPVAKAVKKMKMTTVGWNIRSFDTCIKDKEKVVERIRRKLKPGSVLLLHDKLPESEVLLRLVLEMLDAEGYRVVSLEELFDVKMYE
jgi:peptidoglycan/xylan/chitin deacetylase (PgdA/CDA1 family)